MNVNLAVTNSLLENNFPPRGNASTINEDASTPLKFEVSSASEGDGEKGLD